MTGSELMHRLIAHALLLVAALVATPASAGVIYYHTDHLGSVVAVTDAQGEMIERREYEPFGLRLGEESADGPGYTSHVHDRATGLDYMQQRYYDPACGCFLSVDPVIAYDTGDWRHFNRYSYAYNNPYRFRDPDGQFGVLGAIIGAGIEAGLQIATEGKVTNVSAVVVAGAVGAVTGGLGSVVGKAAVSGAISTTRAVATVAAVGGAANATGKVAEGAITGKGTSPQEAAIAAAVGAAGSAAGAKIGLSAVAKLEAMAAKAGIAGHVGQTTQAAVQQGGRIVGPSTSFTQKAAEMTVDSASSYVEKKINR